MNVDQVRAIALELGFGSVGTGPSIPKRPEWHDAWIEAGCHGEMSWMESHRDVAADPNPRAPRRDPSDLRTGPVPRVCPNTFLHGSGVARYARGKDYHVHTLKRL